MSKTSIYTLWNTSYNMLRTNSTKLSILKSSPKVTPSFTSSTILIDS